MPPADVTGAGAKATATAAGAKAAKAADVEAKFKAEAIVDANLAKHKSPFVLAGDNNTHSTRPTTASRLSGSLTGCSTFQAYSAGCVGNMVIVAESASCAEKNATAIAMANTITQAEQHVRQDLVDLNAVDPQQRQAGCVTSDAPPDQPAVDVTVGTTKAASALSASLSKHMITQANSASCAAENATAIDKVNASTLRHYARGVAGTVRAKALQSAACTPAMTLDTVAIVHASGASPKAASSLSLSCAVNTNTVNAAQSIGSCN